MTNKTYAQQANSQRKRESFLRKLDLTPKESFKLASMPKVLNKIIDLIGTSKTVVRTEKVYITKEGSEEKIKETRRVNPYRYPIECKSSNGIIKYFKNKKDMATDLGFHNDFVNNLLHYGGEYNGVSYREMKGYKMCEKCREVKEAIVENFERMDSKSKRQFRSPCRKCSGVGLEKIKPIRVTNIETDEKTLYKTATKCAQEMGFDRSAMCKVMDGAQKSHRGHYFERVGRLTVENAGLGHWYE